MTGRTRSARGCVYFNFGSHYALQLVVSLHSLRTVYGGPVTVFLLAEPHTNALKRDLETLGASVVVTDKLSKSWDRHNVFYESPYEATLLFDSDIIFRAPIDDLWAPLEREGVLVTRVSAVPGFRLRLLRGIAPLVGPDRYERAIRRVRDERADINVGVMGIARPRGDDFLAEWAGHMERGKGRRIMLLDEMLVVALAGHHPHHLADETWNCPADDVCRTIDAADAKVLHFFADGIVVGGRRLGRDPDSWTGRQWRAAYRAARADLDLSRWRLEDNRFPADPARPFEEGPILGLRLKLRELVRTLGRARRAILRQAR